MEFDGIQDGVSKESNTPRKDTDIYISGEES